MRAATMEMEIPDTGHGKRGTPSRLKGLLRLALAVGLLLLWMFWLAPLLQRNVPPLAKLGKHIDDSGIAANMIYYTEVPATGDAESAMRDALKYAPKGP